MATPLVTLKDFVDNMRFQCDLNPLLASLSASLLAYELLYAAELEYELTQDDKNHALKLYTGCVVSTGTDLNCYPVGLDTTQCFDLSGNEVP